jgi:7-cyano-7-deazaguanine synthase
MLARHRAAQELPPWIATVPDRLAFHNLGGDPTLPHELNLSSGSANALGVLLSGGVDSAILLGDALARGQFVVPIYIRTGCVWQGSELRAVRAYLAAVAHRNLSRLVLLDMPLAELYGEHWSISGRDVPNRRSPDDAVFLPGRNPLLLVKPIVWCQMNGIQQLAIATLQGNPFDDATPGFFARFEDAMSLAGGRRVDVLRPFEALSKRSVIRLGQGLPLELTFSCLRPVDGEHCGQCNKCGERQAALAHREGGDPTFYAGAAVARIH